jgi:putative transposase
MSEYRRHYQTGGTYFFTVVTQQRKNILILPDHITRLHSAIDQVRKRYPFSLEALVILPDHLHCIWRLPDRDSNYSLRWRLIKGYFSIGFSHPANQRGEKEVWQRRFWEHLLRDEADWRRHMDYIYYNPVKHGYVNRPIDWPHSSFRQAIQDGNYDPGWGVVEPKGLAEMSPE